MKVVLGNRDSAYASVKETKDGPVRDMVAHAKGKRYTEMDIPDEYTNRQVILAITQPDGVWANHATPGSTPAWVASDNPKIAELVSSLFDDCEIRSLEEPVLTVTQDGEKVKDPETNKVVTSVNGKIVRAAATSLMLAMTSLLSFRMLMLIVALSRIEPKLKTNAGHDFQAKQMAGSASATAVAKWMALTANTTAPAASDTTLTAEIATAGGGLIRQAAVYAHTGGTNTYTLTGTFIANGTDSLPVTVGKMGVFDAASTGNMPFTTLISPTATLSASGDQVTVTQTVTM